MSELTPFTIRYPNRNKPSEMCQHSGYLVPDTEAVFAIDERWPAMGFEPATWIITHLPSGTQVNRGCGDMSAETRERAVVLAQQFYREAKALGCDLHNADRAVVRAPIDALTEVAKQAFWRRVLA